MSTDPGPPATRASPARAQSPTSICWS
jgi:hypothetical protein